MDQPPPKLDMECWTRDEGISLLSREYAARKARGGVIALVRNSACRMGVSQAADKVHISLDEKFSRGPTLDQGGGCVPKVYYRFELEDDPAQ